MQPTVPMSHPFSNPTTPRPKRHNLTMQDILFTIVGTNKGWLLRQCLKFATSAGVWITAQLSAQGVELDNPQAVVAALCTVVAWLLELVLSKLASKLAAH